ncbi:deoxynucleoside kinase [Bacillus sp. 22475]|uniref:Deoxyguanosine kinase n=23 Tax=Bacilli TaxID=91061 RepID=Q81JC3_BACCR|nr:MULTISPECIES: deoxynucleoside kinase [Bacillus]ABD37691.1 deoxyguanosine kinase [synthetic construct]ANN30236.1 deoxyguanosine kinase [Bacillus thuringiensis serovar coreanensis]MBJ9983785.1 deoxynucleoside kinase [Bacillus sp. S29]MBK0104972.1 deoxynucleoside kinase [Bacillus sp. S70]MBK0110281.1 deoxynucleoside kinase [Bacillus sp. S73]MBK0139101.1 deoxynucleoside kinase [Bacillus sp. S72]MBK0150379.1 deoxynucleoside kinase [Bacillus sp. S74]MBK0161787.1 deoxynucleoside kinase [Bacillu
MTGVPFITVEGPIGVGKTSLAKEISTHMQLHLLKEIVDENPFLGKFYEDIDEWSFQTEMFFLCNRYKQLEDINIKYLNQRKPVVADYHIFKNLIFASRTLKDSQYDKYMQIYRILTQDMPVPNVIVYLTASLETLQKRIAMRGREFEKNMDPNYLLQLTKDYETAMDAFKKDHPEIPVLKFNGDDMDFVKNPDDLNVILSALQNTLLKESK